MKSSTKKRSALHSRKKRLKHSQRLADCHAVVIGAGTLGRAVTILLASLGIKHMSIYDPAFVTRKDLTCGFMDGDEGLAKVDAVANIAHQHNPRMELLTYQCRFRKSHLRKWNPKLKNVVFLCLKTNDERRSVRNRLSETAQFLCDASVGRMIIRIAVSTAPGINPHYASTLVPDVLAKGMSDLIRANTTACLMVDQFMRWLS